MYSFVFGGILILQDKIRLLQMIREFFVIKLKKKFPINYYKEKDQGEILNFMRTQCWKTFES